MLSKPAQLLLTLGLCIISATLISFLHIPAPYDLIVNVVVGGVIGYKVSRL